jgi:4-hydroxybutyryl-CoA dehydratase/vinylacetyl-CoA-Delta-isomerase
MQVKINDRVFLNGERACTEKFLTAIYRAATGACVAGQGDVMIGSAIHMVEGNGLSQKSFQDKLFTEYVREIAARKK